MNKLYIIILINFFIFKSYSLNLSKNELEDISQFKKVTFNSCNALNQSLDKLRYEGAFIFKYNDQDYYHFYETGGSLVYEYNERLKMWEIFTQDSDNMHFLKCQDNNTLPNEPKSFIFVGIKRSVDTTINDRFPRVYTIEKVHFPLDNIIFYEPLRSPKKPDLIRLTSIDHQGPEVLDCNWYKNHVEGKTTTGTIYFLYANTFWSFIIEPESSLYQYQYDIFTKNYKWFGYSPSVVYLGCKTDVEQHQTGEVEFKNRLLFRRNSITYDLLKFPLSKIRFFLEDTSDIDEKIQKIKKVLNRNNLKNLINFTNCAQYIRYLHNSLYIKHKSIYFLDYSTNKKYSLLISEDGEKLLDPPMQELLEYKKIGQNSLFLAYSQVKRIQPECKEPKFFGPPFLIFKLSYIPQSQHLITSKIKNHFELKDLYFFNIDKIDNPIGNSDEFEEINFENLGTTTGATVDIATAKNLSPKLNRKTSESELDKSSTQTTTGATFSISSAKNLSPKLKQKSETNKTLELKDSDTEVSKSKGQLEETTSF